MARPCPFVFASRAATDATNRAAAGAREGGRDRGWVALLGQGRPQRPNKVGVAQLR